MPATASNSTACASAVSLGWAAATRRCRHGRPRPGRWRGSVGIPAAMRSAVSMAISAWASALVVAARAATPAGRARGCACAASISFSSADVAASRSRSAASASPARASCTSSSTRIEPRVLRRRRPAPGAARRAAATRRRAVAPRDVYHCAEPLRGHAHAPVVADRLEPAVRLLGVVRGRRAGMPPFSRSAARANSPKPCTYGSGSAIRRRRRPRLSSRSGAASAGSTPRQCGRPGRDTSSGRCGDRASVPRGSASTYTRCVPPTPALSPITRHSQASRSASGSGRPAAVPCRIAERRRAAGRRRAAAAAPSATTSRCRPRTVHRWNSADRDVDRGRLVVVGDRPAQGRDQVVLRRPRSG